MSNSLSSFWSHLQVLLLSILFSHDINYGPSLIQTVLATKKPIRWSWLFYFFYFLFFDLSQILNVLCMTRFYFQIVVKILIMSSYCWFCDS